MSRRILSGFGAAILALGVMGLTVPSSTAAPDLHHWTELFPLAGDREFYVFAVAPAGDGIYDESTNVVDSIDGNGVVRRVPGARDVPNHNPHEYFLEGDYLAQLSSTGNHVDWWNLASGRHGSVRVHTHVSLIGATPTGFAIDDAAKHRILRVRPSGEKSVVTSYRHFYSGVTGPKGVVVTNGTSLSYFRYSAPGQPTTFRPTLHRPHKVMCSDATGRVAACIVQGGCHCDTHELTATGPVIFLSLTSGDLVQEHRYPAAYPFALKRSVGWRGLPDNGWYTMSSAGMITHSKDSTTSSRQYYLPRAFSALGHVVAVRAVPRHDGVLVEADRHFHHAHVIYRSG